MSDSIKDLLSDHGISGMSGNIKELLKKIDKTYNMAFGRTPLNRRLEDIRKEASELARYTDLRSLKEEAGDLLTTTLQLINECGWDLEEIVDENLAKIKKRRNQYKTLGRKIQVAVIGGGFNPIIDRDLQIANLILHQSHVFDEVHFMPCFDCSANKKLLSTEHRLEMCRIAVQNDARMKVSDYEIANKLNGSTYNLANRLLEDKKFKDTHSFSFVTSLENANTFEAWDSYEDLERLVRFVVIQYPGEKPKRGVDWYLKSPHIFIEPDQPLSDISSSDIRKAFQILHSSSGSARDYTLNNRINFDPQMAFNKGLDKNVKDYILAKGLYK